MRTAFILSRYLSKGFLKWFLIVLTTVICIIALFDFTELLRKTSSRSDIGLSVLLQLLILKLPTLLQQTLPFIAFFATIVALWMFNRHHELTVMKAAGISIWQLLTPLMTAGLFIGAFDLLVMNPLASKMMLRYEHLDDLYFQGHTGNLAISESGLWIRETHKGKRNVYHVRHVDLQGPVFSNLQVFQYDNKDHFEKRVLASTGYLKDGLLQLRNVWEIAVDGLPEKRPALDLSTSLSLRMLEDTGADPQSVSFWEIPRIVSLLEKSGLSGHKYHLYWHSLLARWLWLGVMVMLAAACSMRPLRQGGAVLLIAIGAGSAFLLYFLRDITYALGNSQSLPVMLAAWAPVGISALIGLTYLLSHEDG